MDDKKIRKNEIFLHHAPLQKFTPISFVLYEKIFLNFLHKLVLTENKIFLTKLGDIHVQGHFLLQKFTFLPFNFNTSKYTLKKIIRNK